MGASNTDIHFSHHKLLHPSCTTMQSIIKYLFPSKRTATDVRKEIEMIAFEVYASSAKSNAWTYWMMIEHRYQRAGLDAKASYKAVTEDKPLWKLALECDDPLGMLQSLPNSKQFTTDFITPFATQEQGAMTEEYMWSHVSLMFLERLAEFMRLFVNNIVQENLQAAFAEYKCKFDAGEKMPSEYIALSFNFFCNCIVFMQYLDSITWLEGSHKKNTITHCINDLKRLNL